jgi:hypothetical protein
MSLRQYVQLCEQWEHHPSIELFSRVVAGADVLCRNQRELAKEFRVAESTVSRWAKGYARPHPGVQRYVVSTLRKQALRAVKAMERAPAPVELERAHAEAA